MTYISQLILALAISLDTLSVGFVHGLRNMSFNFINLVIISTLTTISSYIGMELVTILDPSLAEKLGSIFLLLIASWLIYTSYLEKDYQLIYLEKNKINFKTIGFYFLIIKKPLITYNYTKENTISIARSTILGIVLGLDALGGGIAVALNQGSKFFFPLSIAFFTLLFLNLGHFLAKRLKELLPACFKYLPPLILIILAILQLIT